MRRYRIDHDRASSNFYVVADLDVAQNFCTGADHYSVAQCWMALACLFSCATQRHALIQEHVVTNFRCFSNDDAHPVIYKKTSSYFGAGMNFNACECPRKLTHDARERVPTRRIQGMRETMQ